MNFLQYSRTGAKLQERFPPTWRVDGKDSRPKNKCLDKKDSRPKNKCLDKKVKSSCIGKKPSAEFSRPGAGK